MNVVFDKKGSLQQRVAFRIPRDRFKKINEILKKGKYKTQSDFLRNAVDLLLHWEDKLGIDDINDPILRKKIIDREERILKAEKVFPELEKKMVKDLAFLFKTKEETSIFVKNSLNESKKIHEETKKSLKLAEPFIEEYEKRKREDGMELVLFFMQLVRSLYSQFKDEEIPLNIKEWETQTLVDARKLHDKITRNGRKEESYIDRREIAEEIERSTKTKGLTAKEFFATRKTSQFKKEEKKEK